MAALVVGVTSRAIAVPDPLGWPERSTRLATATWSAINLMGPELEGTLLNSLTWQVNFRRERLVLQIWLALRCWGKTT